MHSGQKWVYRLGLARPSYEQRLVPPKRTSNSLISPPDMAKKVLPEAVAISSRKRLARSREHYSSSNRAEGFLCE